MVFLEELTGVTGLVADPTHRWAGLHVFPRGGFQSLHRDFRVHPVTGLFHRVNVIVYLNNDWKSEYAGDLELWKSDKTSCERRIAPVAGRTVIFETSSTTLHGVPDPIRCPPSMARLSLVSDYFTERPGPENPRESCFRRPKRPQDPWYMGFRTWGGMFERIRSSLSET